MIYQIEAEILSHVSDDLNYMMFHVGTSEELNYEIFDKHFFNNRGIIRSSNIVSFFCLRFAIIII